MSLFRFWIALAALLMASASLNAQTAKEEKINKLVYEADQLRNAEKNEEALVVYGKALKLDPLNAGALGGRALAYVNLNLFSKAMEDAQVLKDDENAGYLGWLLIGSIECERLKYEEAKAAFAKAIELEPTESFGYEAMGKLENQFEHYDLAIAQYTKAIEIEPRDIDLRVDRANIYIDMGNLEKAVGELNFIIDNLDRPDYREARARIYRNQRKYKEALEDLEFVIDRYGKNNSRLFLKALLMGEVKRFEESLAILNDLVTRAGPDPDLLAQRSNIKMNLYDFNGAHADIDEAIAKVPEEHYLLTSKGLIYYSSGDFENAEATFTRMFRADSTNEGVRSGYFHNMALVKMRNGQYEESISFTRKAIDLDSTHPYLWNNLGYAQMMLGRMEEAKANMDKSMKMDPDNGWVWRNRGLWRFKNGDAEGALDDLNKALEKDGEFELVHYFMGLVYLSKGNKKTACEQFQISKNRYEPEGEESLKLYCE